MLFMEPKASKALEIVFKAEERKKVKTRKPEVTQQRSGVSLSSDMYCKFVSKKQNKTSVDYRLAGLDSPEIILEYKKSSISPERLSATLLADHEHPAKKLDLLPRASAPATPLTKSRSQPQRFQNRALESNSNWFTPATDTRFESPAIDQSSNDVSPTHTRTQSSAWRTGANFFPVPVNVSGFEHKMLPGQNAAHSPPSAKKSAAPYIHLFRKNVYRSQKNSPLKPQPLLNNLPHPRTSTALPNDSSIHPSRQDSRNLSTSNPHARLDTNDKPNESANNTLTSPTQLTRLKEARIDLDPREYHHSVHTPKSFPKKRMSMSVANNIVASKNGKQSKTSMLRAIVHRSDSFL